MHTLERQLAVITGASTAIGLEFARLYAQDKFDLVIASDEPMIHSAAWELGEMGVNCAAVECALSTPAHARQLKAAIGGRPVDALLVLAGLGFGKNCAERTLEEALQDIQTNIDGTMRLVFEVARGMRRCAKGHIIIVGAIAEPMPGIFQAVYNCSKAFLESFAAALGNELKDTGVTVTCLMPDDTDSGARSCAAPVPKRRPERMKKGNLKLVVGAGNRLHAAMYGAERHFPRRGRGIGPYPLPRKVLQ